MANRLQKGSAAAAMAVALVGSFEGLRQNAYPDPATLPDARFVALTSFAYNVGIRSACGSSAIKLINLGKTAEGCEALLKWNRAAGIVFPGLTRRRQKERQFCLEGI
jgi:lysozyme